MTTQAFPKNKVILYGVVGQRFYRQGDKKTPEPAIRRLRNPASGADYSVALQVASPYGGSYEIEVEVGEIEGASVLERAKAGQGLVLTGYLSRTLDLDDKFRLYDDEIVQGVFFQNVIFIPESVRARGDGDPQGTGSNVAIEGTVVEPPVFFRHPEYPEIEMARIGIATRTTPRVDDVALIGASRPCIVSVIIPTDDEQATLLYRRGNKVRLRGVIERLATRSLRNKVVADRVAEMDTKWTEQRDEIKGLEDPDKARKELNYAGGRYVRDRDRYSRIVRTAVIAVEVTPMPGATPATREEGMAERAVFDAEQRELRRQEREERRSRRRDNQRREAAARAQEAPIAEPVAGEAPAPVAQVKHRRQPKVAEVKAGADTSVPDAELPATEPLAEVEEVHTNGVVEV